MALSGWQRKSAFAAREQMEAAQRRRMELMTPQAPELPQGAIGGLESLVGSYQQAYGAAKSANEARWQQMLGIAGQERQRRMGQYRGMLGVAEQTTGQRAADIRAGGAEEESNIMQQLARQGMGGTTVAPTMREGVRRGTSEKLNRLADQMQQTKLGIMGQMAQPMRETELGIMERREDVYPSQAPMLSALGAVGGGYGSQGLSAMLGALTGRRTQPSGQRPGLPPGAVTSLSPEQYRSKYG